MKYINSAFFFHWNLLAVGTGVVGGMISGLPDIVIPAFAALEVVYLAILSSCPRFQDAVDAMEHRKNLGPPMPDQKLQNILSALSKEDLIRYERLKNLCLELRRIADRVKGNLEEELDIVSDVQVNSINSLLWMYLKLLYSKNALEAFFRTIRRKDIEERIDRTKKLLEEMRSEMDSDDENVTMRRKSLLDTLKISGKRLENYKISMKNYDFIGLELERLNSKIANLAEMGINHQDTTLINSEIDSVSASIDQTERAMNELAFITGISYQDEATPDLLAEKGIKVTHH